MTALHVTSSYASWDHRESFARCRCRNQRSMRGPTALGETYCHWSYDRQREVRQLLLDGSAAFSQTDRIIANYCRRTENIAWACLSDRERNEVVQQGLLSEGQLLNNTPRKT